MYFDTFQTEHIHQELRSVYNGWLPRASYGVVDLDKHFGLVGQELVIHKATSTSATYSIHRK